MKVAIIGAGLAGVTAAKELARLGVFAEVFEKSPGLGGRLAAIRRHWGNIDIGAQYFTARDARFIAQVALWRRFGVVKPWLFTPYCLKHRQLQISSDNELRYVGLPSMNSVVNFQAEGLSIHRKTDIQGVERVGGLWQLTATDGRVFKGYEWIICALPAEQSVKLLQNVSSITQSIPMPVHSPCAAVAVATRGCVPQEIQGIFGDHEVTWASRLSAKPGFSPTTAYDDLWLLHFSQEYSEVNNANVNRQRIRQGKDWLQRITGVSLEFVYSLHHHWQYAKARFTPLDPLQFNDVKQKIMVIGDWINGGRVEGAYLSGLNVPLGLRL